MNIAHLGNWLRYIIYHFIMQKHNCLSDTDYTENFVLKEG